MMVQILDKDLLKKYDLVVTTTGNINVLDKHMLGCFKIWMCCMQYWSF